MALYASELGVVTGRQRRTVSVGTELFNKHFAIVINALPSEFPQRAFALRSYVFNTETQENELVPPLLWLPHQVSTLFLTCTKLVTVRQTCTGCDSTTAI